MDITTGLLNNGLAGGLVVCLIYLLKALTPIVRAAFKSNRDGNTRLTNLETGMAAMLLNESGNAQSKKLDLALDELKQLRQELVDIRDAFNEAYRLLSERIARAEAHITTILNSHRP